MLRTHLTPTPAVRERGQPQAPTQQAVQAPRQPGAVRLRGVLARNAEKFVTLNGEALVRVRVALLGCAAELEAYEAHGNTPAGHIAASSKANNLRRGCPVHVDGSGIEAEPGGPLRVTAPVTVIKVIHDDEGDKS